MPTFPTRKTRPEIGDRVRVRDFGLPWDGKEGRVIRIDGEEADVLLYGDAFETTFGVDQLECV
jgi:hypothetical protein